jgi:hypothetical protein
METRAHHRAPAPSHRQGRALPGRVVSAWRRLDPDQRLAGLAAGGLFVSMFLPWYQATGFSFDPKHGQQQLSNNLSAFQVFTFIEAAVLLVAVGTLLLLFARGEQRAFHLPFGDGPVIMAGGIWVALLIFIRQLDKPSGQHSNQIATTIGVQWGIFVAFVIGLLLAYAGFRIRRDRVPEPARRPRPPQPPDETTETAVMRRRGGESLGGQLSFDEDSGQSSNTA